MSETDILRRILRDLGARPDLRLWRQSSGVGRALHNDAVVRFGIPGCADLSGIITHQRCVFGCQVDLGVRLEIEVKTPTRRQSKQQVAFQAMIEKFGGVYILCRSTEDALTQLRDRGYCLK